MAVTVKDVLGLQDAGHACDVKLHLVPVNLSTLHSGQDALVHACAEAVTQEAALEAAVHLWPRVPVPPLGEMRCRVRLHAAKKVM